MTNRPSTVGYQPSIGEEAIGVYVHIPFCVRKCFYCDFNSETVNSRIKTQYMNALNREIETDSQYGRPVRTLLLGGGTPSELSFARLEALLDRLRDHFDFGSCEELTIECNPDTVDELLFDRLLRLGFNRISLGVQSFDDRYLAYLGRVHNADEARQAVRSARSAGVANLNLDLIFGLHDQTIEQWHSDLEQAIALEPEHLSVYGLTIEPGTDFGRLQRAGRLPVINDDLVADMFELTRELTRRSGYAQYEICNFARAGRTCRQNLIYWRNEPYLGFGVSAASYMDGRRWTNTASLKCYSENAGCRLIPRHSEEELEGEAAAGEAAILGLRTVDGISVAALSERYGIDFTAAFGCQIDFLLEHQLLRRQHQRLRLTSAGQLLASEVGQRFLP